MGEVKIRYGGTTYNMSQFSPKNPPYGNAKINFKVNNTSTEKYGLTSDVSASQYCKFRVRVNGYNAYLGTSGSSITSITNSGNPPANTSGGNSTFSSTRVSSSSSSVLYSNSDTNTFNVFSAWMQNTIGETVVNATSTNRSVRSYTATSMQTYTTYNGTFTKLAGNYTTALNGTLTRISVAYYSNTYSLFLTSQIFQYGTSQKVSTISQYVGSTTATNNLYSNGSKSVTNNTKSYVEKMGIVIGGGSSATYSYGTGAYYSSESKCSGQYASSMKFSMYVYGRIYHYGSFFLATNASGNWTRSAGFADRTNAINGNGVTWGSNNRALWYQSHSNSGTANTTASYGPMTISSGVDYNDLFQTTYSAASYTNNILATHSTYEIQNGDEVPFIDNWTATSTNNASLKYGVSFLTSNSGAKRWGRTAVANYYNYNFYSSGTTRYTMSSYPAGQTITSFGSAKSWRRWIVWSNRHTYISKTSITTGIDYNTSNWYNRTYSLSYWVSRSYTVDDMYISQWESRYGTTLNSTLSQLIKAYSVSTYLTTHNYNV